MGRCHNKASVEWIDELGSGRETPWRSPRNRQAPMDWSAAVGDIVVGLTVVNRS
jgi:hypothetical protein